MNFWADCECRLSLQIVTLQGWLIMSAQSCAYHKQEKLPENARGMLGLADVINACRGEVCQSQF